MTPASRRPGPHYITVVTIAGVVVELCCCVVADVTIAGVVLLLSCVVVGVHVLLMATITQWCYK